MTLQAFSGGSNRRMGSVFFMGKSHKAKKEESCL